MKILTRLLLRVLRLSTSRTTAERHRELRAGAATKAKKAVKSRKGKP